MKAYFLLLLIILSGQSFCKKTSKVIYNKNEAGLVINDISGIGIIVNKYSDGLLVQSLYFDKDSVPTKYRTHTKYFYKDEKLINSQDYLNDRKLKWEFASRQIKYYNNRIELTFPKAKTNLSKIEKMFEKPSKIVFHLDTIGRIIKKSYLNENNETVPHMEMRIRYESFIYNETGRLDTIRSYYGYGKPYTVWSHYFIYPANSSLPSSSIKKMNEAEADSNITHYHYSTSNIGWYATSKHEKYSGNKFPFQGAQSIPFKGQFFAEYWNNGIGIPQITMEQEIRIIWQQVKN